MQKLKVVPLFLLALVVCLKVPAQTNNSDELYERLFNTEKYLATAKTNSLDMQTRAVDQKIYAKIYRVLDTKTVDLSAELAELDAIYDRHRGEDAENLAALLVYKYFLYVNVSHQPDQAVAVMKKLVAELPDTTPAKEISPILKNLPEALKGREWCDSLKRGDHFPEFDEKDMNGQPISLAGNLKGKIVLLNFWNVETALVFLSPDLKKFYEKYHDRGFEIVGVNLNTNEVTVREFVKTNGITWPQYFDGKGQFNKLAVKYGTFTPIREFLIDTDGNFLTTDIYLPESLEAAVLVELRRKEELKH